MKFEDKRPKAIDIHKELSEWFPAGYSRTREDFERAAAAGSGGGGKEAAGKPLAWAERGRRVGEEVLEVEGAPRLELRHVKLADAPEWFKVGRARGPRQPVPLVAARA